ncbi:MAG: hypothetical protein QMC73_16575 [Myxococcota bacterium]
MLAAHTGSSPVDLASSIVQLLVAARGASIDAVAHPPILEGVPICFFRVRRLVAVEHSLFTVNQVR